MSAGTRLVIRQAGPADVTMASDILVEAAAWLADRGIPMWPPEDLTVEELRPAIEDRQVYLAWLNGTAVGIFSLQYADERFWPDAIPGEAAYVHRLAVRRSVAGQGVAAAMLKWAQETAARAGYRYLRLDCDGRRPPLRQFYEQFGFSLHSERVRGAFLLARYQLLLVPV